MSLRTQKQKLQRLPLRLSVSDLRTEQGLGTMNRHADVLLHNPFCCGAISKESVQFSVLQVERIDMRSEQNANKFWEAIVTC